MGRIGHTSVAIVEAEPGAQDRARWLTLLHLRTWRARGLRAGGFGLVVVMGIAAVGSATPRDEPSVADLKARIASASVADRAHLCVQIAQKQMDETGKLYAAGDIAKGQATLTDVVAYSQLARDYSIQSHKHQKQTEIAVRGMTRKLNDLAHTLGHDEQEPVTAALKQLEQVRDDLLASMFKKGQK